MIDTHFHPLARKLAGLSIIPTRGIYDYNRQSFQNLDTHGASLTLNTKLLGADLVSISAYERVHKLYGEDSDGGPIPAVAVTNPVALLHESPRLALAKAHLGFPRRREGD